MGGGICHGKYVQLTTCFSSITCLYYQNICLRMKCMQGMGQYCTSFLQLCLRSEELKDFPDLEHIQAHSGAQSRATEFEIQYFFFFLSFLVYEKICLIGSIVYINQSVLKRRLTHWVQVCSLLF